MMNKSLMRKVFIYFIFTVITVVLQFGFHDLIIINGVRPDLFIVFCIITGYLYGTGDAIVIGIISGFLKDSFSGRFIGLGILTCLFCGLFAAVFLKRYMTKNIFIALIQIFAGTIIYSLIIYSTFYLFTDMRYSIMEYIQWVLSKRFLPMLMLNLAFAVLYYILLQIFSPYSKKKSIYDEVIKSGYFSGEYI